MNSLHPSIAQLDEILLRNQKPQDIIQFIQSSSYVGIKMIQENQKDYQKQKDIQLGQRKIYSILIEKQIADQKQNKQKEHNQVDENFSDILKDQISIPIGQISFLKNKKCPKLLNDLLQKQNNQVFGYFLKNQNDKENKNEKGYKSNNSNADSQQNNLLNRYYKQINGDSILLHSEDDSLADLIKNLNNNLDNSQQKISSEQLLVQKKMRLQILKQEFKVQKSQFLQYLKMKQSQIILLENQVNEQMTQFRRKEREEAEINKNILKFNQIFFLSDQKKLLANFNFTQSHYKFNQFSKAIQQKKDLSSFLIRVIDLSGNFISNKFIETLHKSKLNQLKILKLNNTGLNSLGQFHNFSKLQCLQLYNSEIASVNAPFNCFNYEQVQILLQKTYECLGQLWLSVSSKQGEDQQSNINKSCQCFVKNGLKSFSKISYLRFSHRNKIAIKSKNKVFQLDKLCKNSQNKIQFQFQGFIKYAAKSENYIQMAKNYLAKYLKIQYSFFSIGGDFFVENQQKE